MPSRRIAAAAVTALVVVLLAVGTYFGAWRQSGGNPGYAAVIEGCGILTMSPANTDWRFNCLNGIWSAVSVSGDGKTLAWDTRNGIDVANADLSNPRLPTLPAGANVEPSLSPDGRKVAFLHSPKDDGKYDVWVVTVSAVDDAQQLTSSRDVSSDAWSPAGDWIAYVKGWSEQTLVGDIMLIHPNGTGERKIARGDAPAWSPDGSQLAFVRDNKIWTIDTDGTGEHVLIDNAHAPAWSRDGSILSFSREDPCGKAVCTEHVYYMKAGRPSTVKLVGPVFTGSRRVLWVTGRSVSKPPPTASK